MQYSHHRRFISHNDSMENSTNKKLIKRWDSERELSYDDIAHVLQNTKITL